MDNVTTAVTIQTTSTALDWATFGATLGILLVAFIGLLIARWQLRLQSFVRLLEEIASDKASSDRGIVRKK